MKNEYDLIVSLGGNCFVAKQLQHRGMRPFSLALDWVFMSEPRCVKELCGLLRSRFDGFCLYENIIEHDKPDREGHHMTYKFTDKKLGFGFVHHFHSPLSDRAGFDRDRATIGRRIDRIYEKVSSVKNVLFILENSFMVEEAVVMELYRTLCEVFPGVEVDLYSMQFNADEESHKDVAANVRISKYHRRGDVANDVYGTSYEWEFLDGIRLKGTMKPKEKRKKCLLTKWKYSLWKALGKSLYKEGAGCVGITLP